LFADIPWPSRLPRPVSLRDGGEYQDTTPHQFKLIQALTQEHRNLCVVGDDDQSIYGWRGAEISTCSIWKKHFPK